MRMRWIFEMKKRERETEERATERERRRDFGEDKERNWIEREMGR